MIAVADPPHAEEEIRLLAQYLRRGKPALLLATTPDTDAERELTTLIRSYLEPKIQIEVLSFGSAERTNLGWLLSQLPMPTQPGSVFVFGLDELSPADRASAIEKMNWGRESLRQIPYTMVLWVRPNTPGEIGNRAPDFFSWRSKVFEFPLSTEPDVRRREFANLGLALAYSFGSLEQTTRAYREYLIESCLWLDVRGLLQLRNIVRLPLEEVFVPLRLRRTVQSDEFRAAPLDPSALKVSNLELEDLNTNVRSQVMPKILVSVGEALKENNRIVILGDPGAGKSSLLRYLALLYARGPEVVIERLELTEPDRLPILAPLAEYARAKQKSGSSQVLPLAQFLADYACDLSSAPVGHLVSHALKEGTAIVLLDGLDEMINAGDRMETVRAIDEFAAQFPMVRVIVTSRIAGYGAAQLGPTFTVYTVAPFDDDAIRQFVRLWARAFEASGLTTSSQLSTPAQRRVEAREEGLFSAATATPPIRRLASNPLLLTLIALIHHQGTRLPYHRGELYRLCIEALSETWNLARSLTQRPIDLYLGSERISEHFVVRLLGPVAFWMHEHYPGGIVSEEKLVEQISQQLAKRPSSLPAAEAARDTIRLMREQTGLLVERGPGLFGFLHLTFQEYLAARYLSGRTKPFTLLRPHRHNPRWREVLLLTAANLPDEHGTAFVDDLLNATAPIANFAETLQAITPGRSSLGSSTPGKLNRSNDSRLAQIRRALEAVADLFIVVECIGDDVEIRLDQRVTVFEDLFLLWRGDFFSGLRTELSRVFRYAQGSGIGHLITQKLISLAQDDDSESRTEAIQALADMRVDRVRATQLFLQFIKDYSVPGFIRESFLIRAMSRKVDYDTEQMRNGLEALFEDEHQGIKIRARALWIWTLFYSKREESIHSVQRFATTGTGELQKEAMSLLRNMLGKENGTENTAQTPSLDYSEALAAKKSVEQLVNEKNYRELWSIFLERYASFHIWNAALEVLTTAPPPDRITIQRLMVFIADSHILSYYRIYAIELIARGDIAEPEIVNALVKITSDLLDSSNTDDHHVAKRVLGLLWKAFGLGHSPA
jgi:energy-coupling factor transporter ATP-binding protein EcfA2